MKNIIKIVIFMATLIFLSLFTGTISRHVIHSESKCMFTPNTFIIQCLGTKKPMNIIQSCENNVFNPKKLKYEYFKNEQTPLIYMNPFFKLYHNKNLNNPKISRISKKIITIAGNINNFYHSVGVKDQARIMLQELFALTNFDKVSKKQKKAFNEEYDNIYDLMCQSYQENLTSSSVLF